MPFRNPIVAGLTLIRAAIKSPNYSAGVSGWTINRDGSAEFNDVTARGNVVIGAPSTLTEITNQIPSVLQTKYPMMTSVTLWTDTGGWYWYAGPQGQGYYVVGVVRLGVALEIYRMDNASGVFFGSGGDPVTIDIGDISNGSSLYISSVSSLTVDGRILLRTGGTLDGDISYDGISLSRGLRLYERYSGAPFSSTTAATTEQVMATSASATYRNGRAYRITWAGKVDSATLMTVQPRVRLGSLTGTNLVSGGSVDTRSGSADVDFIRTNIVKNTSGSDITSTIVLTFQNGSAAVSNFTGTGSAANTLEIVDVGDSTDYTNATAM